MGDLPAVAGEELPGSDVIAVITNGLQHDLVTKTPERVGALKAIEPRLIDLLQATRSRGHHVIHMQLINLVDDPNAEWYGDFLPAQAGTPGAAILPQFLHPSDVIIEKNKDNGFYDTELHARLQGLGVTAVVLTGMQAHVCVQTAAADAFFRGYNVWTPGDCVASARDADRLRALEWLDGYCATVADSGEFLDMVDAGGRFPRKAIVMR